MGEERMGREMKMVDIVLRRSKGRRQVKQEAEWKCIFELRTPESHALFIGRRRTFLLVQLWSIWLRIHQENSRSPTVVPYPFQTFSINLPLALPYAVLLQHIHAIAVLMSFEKRLRGLDIFKKVPSDFAQPTNLGGCISLVTLFLILTFTFIELRNYLSPEYAAEINMDKLFTREEMTINLDISFHALPCQLISLDLEDIMMSHAPNIGSVEKWRLDKEGNYIDRRNYELLHEQNPARQLQAVRQALQNKYGCRLVGSFTVKQVPGNFHISCHAYFNHYMQMKMEGKINALDTSHTIHQLYFGKEHHLKTIRSRHPEAALHLLQGKKVVSSEGMSAHYHIDIVPTWYHQSAINNYYTYQYTFTENAYPAQDQPPVVHFIYQIGGLIVEIKPLGEDLFVFMIHLCAILGGTYAIARAAHNLINNFTNKFEYQLIQ